MMATVTDNRSDHFNKRRLYGEELPQELWLDIFVRSSAESVLRVKCVCTRWRGLVSNTSFLKQHLQFQKEMSRKNGRFLLTHNERNNFISNCFLFDEESVTSSAISSSSSENNLLHSVTRRDIWCIKAIEGPINGLYCVFNGSDRVAIWNPATKEVGLLPSPRESLTCVNNIDEGVIGFCIDPSNEADYKVVLICSFYYEDMDMDEDVGFYRMLYTTNTNSWRIIDDNDDHDFAGEGCPDKYTSNNTLVNGTYYWLGELEDDVHCVLAFDTSKEVFRWIPIPFTLSENSCGDIALLNDYIHLFTVNKDVCQIDIWVLMVEEDIWIKRYTNMISGIRRVEKSLGFWRKYDELLLVIDDYYNGQTVLYNTTSGERTNLGPKGLTCSFKALVHYESLESLSGGIIKFKGNHDSCLDVIRRHFLSDEDWHAADQDD